MAFEEFNLTNVTSSKSYFEFATNTNKLVNNELGLIILLMIGLVFFISLMKKGMTAGKSFAVTSWIVALSSMSLFYLQLIGGTVFWVSLLLPGASILMLFLGTRD